MRINVPEIYRLLFSTAFSLPRPLCALTSWLAEETPGPLPVLPCPLLSPIRGAGWRWVTGHLCPGYPSWSALCCLHPVAQSQNPYWAHLPTTLGCGYSTFPGLCRPPSDIHEPNLSLDLWYYFMIALKPTYTFIYKLFIKFSVTQFENARCFLPECD